MVFSRTLGFLSFFSGLKIIIGTRTTNKAKTPLKPGIQILSLVQMWTALSNEKSGQLNSPITYTHSYGSSVTS